MLPTREQRILWLANVRNLPFRERVEAAAKGNFGWLTTSPHDYEQLRASGLYDADIRSIAADNGVRLTSLDPLATWVPDWQPRGVSAEIVAYFDRAPDEFFRIADALQVDKIHVVGAFPSGRYDTDFLIERYAAICDRAAQNGLRCTIEAIPLYGLKTLDEVWRIVDGAGRPNSGIVFDSWHYIRAGRDDARLRALLELMPRDVIDSVQLADGPLQLPAGHSLVEDCVFHRQPVGEGEMPILEIVDILNATGHLDLVGPEIFSAELDELNGEAIIDRIVPGFDAVFAASQNTE